jgi:hypothetical protein
MSFKGFLVVIAVTAATAAFWPAAGGAGTFRGIVVAKQHGTLFVASPAGLVRTVTGRAAIGSRVVLNGRTATVVGTARMALIRGIVVRRIGRTVILSSNRHLIAIPNRVGRLLADRAPAPATTTAPVPGAVVTAHVTIENGTLEEDDENEVGQVGIGSIQVQATVKAVGPGTVTLDVQGQVFTVNLPAGLTLPASLVNQTVTLSLSLNDDNDDDSGHDSGHDGGGDD